MFRPDSHPRARPVRRGDTELADETSEDVLPRSETTHTAPQDTALVPALASGSGPALSASKVAAAIVPTPQSIKIMLVVVAAVAIFLLGVWWARRTPQVAVEAMAHEPTASPTPSSIFSGLPAPPTTPVAPDSPVLDPVDPIEEVEPSSAPSAPIPASVNAAKKGLVERIRSLRRTKFDGVFQRKLTALSSRVTRARTDEEIADISAQISRLERE